MVSHAAACRETGTIVDDILGCGLLIRSIWRLGELANGELGGRPPYAWDLMAFGDPMTLERLRRAEQLHRPDVRIRVVTDGDRFAVAWGGEGASGSLAQCEWRESGPTQAFYTSTVSGVEGVRRARCRAVRLWPEPDSEL